MPNIVPEESSEPPEPMVHLISSEGESFDVALRVARTSELVRSMVDDYSGDEAQEIPLPNVKSTILALVVEFIRRNAAEPMNEIEKVRLQAKQSAFVSILDIVFNLIYEKKCYYRDSFYFCYRYPEIIRF